MSDDETGGRLTGVALSAALIVMAAWLVLLTWLAFHTGVNEMQWARLGSVLGSLEAVAFAAAGALFGTTVQKQRVKDANDRAKAAEQLTTQYRQEAAKGRALATAVKAEAPFLAAVQAAKPQGAEHSLVIMANEMFKD